MKIEREYSNGLKEYPVNRWKLESHIFGGDS